MTHWPYKKKCEVDLMKRFKFFMIITTIIILLIGCSSDQTSSDDKKDTVKKGDKEQITISFGTWNKGTENEPNLERSLIKAFEAEYPHIKDRKSTRLNSSHVKISYAV